MIRKNLFFKTFSCYSKWKIFSTSYPVDINCEVIAVNLVLLLIKRRNFYHACKSCCGFHFMYVRVGLLIKNFSLKMSRKYLGDYFNLKLDPENSLCFTSIFVQKIFLVMSWGFESIKIKQKGKKWTWIRLIKIDILLIDAAVLRSTFPFLPIFYAPSV